jgi:16S rRNA (guanine(527)-N(7))-methyltransferase RsmG
MPVISEDPKIWIRTVCARNGLRLDETQVHLLDRYVGLLLERNQDVNLISRRDEENVWQHHILHSLSPLFLLSFPRDARIVDIGSGGGLPGIPMKIARPDLHLALLDATRKKIDAVSSILQAIDLKGVVAIWGRAEEIVRENGIKNSFDIAIARAVGPLPDLAKWSLKLLKPTASAEPRFENSDRLTRLIPPLLVAMKGGDLEAEKRKTTHVKGVKSVEEFLLSYEGGTYDDAAGKKIVLVRF